MGMKRPAASDSSGFDAGAKYHVAADVPYARYFLADMLQFQFHRALCREAGYTGPLHRCSIYDNPKAGAKLRQMLAMGASKFGRRQDRWRGTARLLCATEDLAGRSESPACGGRAKVSKQNKSALP
jgi:hypothetical protein